MAAVAIFGQPTRLAQAQCDGLPACRTPAFEDIYRGSGDGIGAAQRGHNQGTSWGSGFSSRNTGPAGQRLAPTFSSVSNQPTYTSAQARAVGTTAGSRPIPVPQGNRSAGPQGPAPAPQVPPVPAATSDPVDRFTGEFFLSNVDLEFPGFGVPFRLERLYRSRVDLDGPLGYGWDHSLNQHIEAVTSVITQNRPKMIT